MDYIGFVGVHPAFLNFMQDLEREGYSTTSYGLYHIAKRAIKNIPLEFDENLGLKVRYGATVLTSYPASTWVVVCKSTLVREIRTIFAPTPLDGYSPGLFETVIVTNENFRIRARYL